MNGRFEARLAVVGPGSRLAGWINSHNAVAEARADPPNEERFVKAS
jgi:hypothetical protein